MLASDSEVATAAPDAGPDTEPVSTAPRPKTRRSARVGGAPGTRMFSAVPPEEGRRVPAWNRLIPHDKPRPPLVWLLGAHGGAGVSTLAQQLAFAASCERQWPAVLDDDLESPYVVVVCRETVEGLTGAFNLLRQWHCNLAGPRVQLLGLITSAHQPGHTPKPVSRYLKVISKLVPEDGLWRMPWQPDWPVTALSELPVWDPDEDTEPGKRDPLKDIRVLGEAMMTRAYALTYGYSATKPAAGEEE